MPISLSARITKLPFTTAQVMKQVNFGTARGLTQTAKDGQAASVSEIKEKFTTRGNWFNQNMRHGIRIKSAKPADLKADVHTDADWLEPHERGGTKTGRGNRLGVPTFAMRPRGSKKILSARLRPKALLAAGKAFIMQTPRGEVIARVKGKDRVEVLYGLEPSVKIKRTSTFYDPIRKVVDKNLKPNIDAGISHAFRTARW